MKRILTILVAVTILSFPFVTKNLSKDSSSIQNVNSDYIQEDKITEQEKTINVTEATVKRVVDGDTAVMLIDNQEYKVRFIGVDTPESTKTVEPYGKEASNFSKKMLTGKTVYLQKDISDTDKYGRLLRYVWLEKPTSDDKKELESKMYNAILVKNGYATTATFPPDVKYASFFKELQAYARTNQLGLWQK